MGRSGNVIEKDGKPYWRNTGKGQTEPGEVTAQVLTPLTPSEERAYEAGRETGTRAYEAGRETGKKVAKATASGCLLSLLFLPLALPYGVCRRRHSDERNTNEPYNR